MFRQRLFKTLEIPPGHIVRTVEWIFKSTAATVSISITGDFCSEPFPSLPLHKDDKGVWRIQVMLTPGRYRYQFIINGRWLNDLKNCDFSQGRRAENHCAVRIE
jgi:1,4-alpha-glucan branching enzyme